jgi:hypothetical protein
MALRMSKKLEWGVWLFSQGRAYLWEVRVTTGSIVISYK